MQSIVTSYFGYLPAYLCSLTRGYRQQQLFEAQLRIAATAGLPLLLHSRKAHDQVLATLRRTKFKHGGIVHAFNGSLQQARYDARIDQLRGLQQRFKPYEKM